MNLSAAFLNAVKNEYFLKNPPTDGGPLKNKMRSIHECR